MKPQVAKVDFTTYKETVAAALDLIGAGNRLPQAGEICLKPNLVLNSPPPVTTPIECVAAVYEYIRQRTKAEIFIGEGCGSGNTTNIFESLGFAEFARQNGLELVDFNEAEIVELNEPRARQWKTMKLPRRAVESFIVSIPVLKDHSFTKTTIALKNMFGIVPEPYYGGNWNKSALHSPSTDISVFDVCLYKQPDLSVVDAVTALTGMHLSGTPKKLNTILASFDPVAVDTVGSGMLGHDPKRLEYLQISNDVLGSMDGIELVST